MVEKEEIASKEDFKEAVAGKKVEKIQKVDKKIPEEVKPITNATSKNNIKRERIILASFLAIIVLFAILFYNWGSNQEQKHYVTMSDFNFRQGVLLNLPGPSEIDFNFNDVGYLAKVGFDEGKMNLIIGDSEDFLFVGDSFSYDLNGDSEDDLFVRFESYREGSADIYFIEIYEFDCPENWECTDWGPCINNLQNRVCVDLNSCDVELEKPEFVKVCGGSSIDYFEPTSSRGENSISCGQGINDCFLSAAEDCSLAKTEASFLTDLEGVLITETYILEIKGEEGETCNYFEKLIEINLDYNEDLVNEFLFEGYTLEEIENEKNLMGQGLKMAVGIWEDCSIDKENLFSKLNLWASGDFESRSSCYFGDEGLICDYFQEFIGEDCSLGFK